MLLEVEQISTFDQIDEIYKLKEPYEELWTTAAHFSTCYEKWMNGPFLQVNAENVEEEVCYNFALRMPRILVIGDRFCYERFWFTIQKNGLYFMVHLSL